MGCGGGSTSSTTVQQIPPEVLEQYKNLISKANVQSEKPYEQYSGDLIAGTTGYQDQAYQNLANLQGRGQAYYNSAAGYADAGASPVTGEQIQGYMSPYQQQVINATMANMQENNAQQANQLTGNAIASGAFGGDRAGVAQAELARQQSLANNQTLADLYNSGYSQALSAAQQDKQNALTAGGQYQNLGTSASQTGLSEADALLNAGNQQQQQAQNILNTQYEQWQNQQQYPYEMLTWLSQLSTGLGSNMGGSSTTTSDSGGKATGGRIGRAAGGALSTSLGKLQFPQGGANLPTAPAVQPKGDQTLATLANAAKVALMFLKDGGRVGLATGGAFTPSISPAIASTAQVPGLSGTFLPKPKTPLSSLQQGNFSRTNLPTAPAAPPPKDNSGDLISLLGSSLALAGREDPNAKTDKAQYIPAGDVGRVTGASAPVAGRGAGDALKAAATVATAPGDPNALPQDLDMFARFWNEASGLFAQGGAITPNAGGLGFRRGGGF